MKSITYWKLSAFAMLGIATLVAFAAPARAVSLVIDQFDYADGELTLNDGTGDNVSGGLWQGHSGTGFDDNVVVIGGQAEILNSGSEDVNRSRNPSTFLSAGGKWYYAALVTVNDRRADPSTESINNDYFLHFKDTGTSNFRARTYVSDPNVADPSKFTFGVSASSGGQSDAWATDLDFGTQYKVVGSYEFDTGIAELWVDPVDESSTKIVGNTGTSPGTFITSIALRQDFIGGTPNNQILIDAVGFGTDFDSVVANVMDPSVNIPEPTSMLLAMFGALGLGFGYASRRSC